jgi:heme/copper-type cytochrome/quinol oxidase subunit 1
VGHFHYV